MQFKDVIGLEEQKAALRQEVLRDAVSHAKLFLGKAGHGGLALALAYTQYLFCQNRTETDSCGACPACLKVDQLQHPDVHFSFPVVQALGKTSDAFLDQWRLLLEKTKVFSLNQWLSRIDERERKPIISSEESQAIIRKLSLRSFEGGYKVMIIWMAEEMHLYCANKLLKILEEPTKDTVFILLSEQSESLLPTIISRTQLFRIPRVDPESMCRVIQLTRPGIKDPAAIINRAEGDLIAAMTILAESEDEAALKEQFMQLMRVCFKKDVIKMMDWAEEASVLQREKQKEFLEYALFMFRQSMLMNYTGEQLTRVSEAEDAFLKNFSKFITGNNIFDFIEHFNKAHYHLERNANARILFTALCFKVMRFIHQA
ncbi:MAG: polymerase subunit delta [Bacteroidota bacterium]